MLKKHLLYVVDHSYPYSTDGYAVRTHAVAQSFMSLGFRVTVVNRLGRLWSRKGFSHLQVQAEQVVDGVRYLFLQEPAQPQGMPFSDWKPLAIEAYAEIIRVFRPNLVMAASNYENAEPVLEACSDSVPFIYEVRGFWELTRATKDKRYAESGAYVQAKVSEAKVAQRANYVLTLNRLMKEELIRRGVPGSKIALIPNSLTELPRSPKHREWRAELDITVEFLFGYIGSFNDYEGLEYLVEALAELRKRRLNAAVIFVGSDAQQGVDEKHEGLDAAQQRLFDLAGKLGITDFVSFTGRLSPEDTASVYEQIDIVVNPRKNTPVTNLVSSLKSIEALAHGKPLILSDIPPHQELADEGAPVTLFRADDVSHLSTILINVINNLTQYNPSQSITWVSENRLYASVLSGFQIQALRNN